MVYAHGLGPCGRKAVGVQVPPRAQMQQQLRSGLNAAAGLAALLLLAAAINFVLNFSNANQDSVIIAGKSFTVEVADTPDERAKGLMGRLVLGRDQGMLFVFEDISPRHFWNQDTLIPLDVIFINDNQVVAIELLPKFNRATGPVTVSPAPPAKYVLELNQGSGVKLGDEASFKLLAGS